MISVDYVQAMARYNRWQNQGYIALLADQTPEMLLADRGAFFGSIQATLNHILWADRMWMCRLADWSKPDLPEDWGALYPTFAAWRAERERVDGRLVTWADGLRPAELRGDLTWFSGLTGTEQTQARALCTAHMFNHQTHHRGQVHGMLTAAGLSPQATDLPFMPAEVW